MHNKSKAKVLLFIFIAIAGRMICNQCLILHVNSCAFQSKMCISVVCGAYVGVFACMKVKETKSQDSAEWKSLLHAFPIPIKLLPLLVNRKTKTFQYICAFIRKRSLNFCLTLSKHKAQQRRYVIIFKLVQVKITRLSANYVIMSLAPFRSASISLFLYISLLLLLPSTPHLAGKQVSAAKTFSW